MDMEMDDASSPPGKSSFSDLPKRRKEISGLIARLLNHYWTADDDPAMRRVQAEDWINDLVEFEAEDVQNACREWRQNQTRRPTPADIRLLAIAEHRRRNPVPDPPYIPPPAPRNRTPEDIAAVEANMRIFFERNRKAFGPEPRMMQAQINEAVGVAATACPKGSCHRHQACMYTPCRGVKTGIGKPAHEDPEALRRGRIELGLEEP